MMKRRTISFSTSLPSAGGTMHVLKMSFSSSFCGGFRSFRRLKIRSPTVLNWSRTSCEVAEARSTRLAPCHSTHHSCDGGSADLRRDCAGTLGSSLRPSKSRTRFVSGALPGPRMRHLTQEPLLEPSATRTSVPSPPATTRRRTRPSLCEARRSRTFRSRSRSRTGSRPAWWKPSSRIRSSIVSNCMYSTLTPRASPLPPLPEASSEGETAVSRAASTCPAWQLTFSSTARQSRFLQMQRLSVIRL
mmetsp:Transcript_50180/g.160629  ORF Transcript_50180/g.160629 Transcript_50180/m.160629 type:complete len:246 (-) Transcript_50180:816-1553(-)